MEQKRNSRNEPNEQLIFYKDTKTMQWEKEVFSTNGNRAIGYLHAKNIILIHIYVYLMPYKRLSQTGLLT